MSARSEWQDGRRAWERLNGWHRPPAAGEQRGTPQVEKALVDIRFVRALLDRAELNAVRAARGAGASWTDVATMLGVTRQAAWERWREVDEAQPTAGTA
jgi:hypothetical protein